MPDASQAANAERLLVAWLERTIGRVVRIAIQPRWRPAWSVDVERDGKILPLYVKGARDDVHALVPVRLEGAAIKIMNESGIPTPFQYGYCEAVDAIVMERLPGESRLEDITDIALRDSVADQYVQAMVRLHALDPERFVAAGFAWPRDPVELRLAQFTKTEGMYLSRKRIAEPCNEFLRLWVRRNVPSGDIKPAFISGDAFQMMYHQGKLMGVMDLEMACIGDPLLDLACIRMRDLSEKTGNAATITRRYQELSGKPIDMTALRFHLVAFSTASSLLISDVLSKPADDTDYFEYFVYYWGSLRIALEALAECLGVTLEKLPPPQPLSTPQTIHLDMLANSVEQLAVSTEIETYRRSKAIAEIAYLTRQNAYGGAFDSAYLDDVETLIGTAPANVFDADIRLEAFVREAGADKDVALLHLLYRRALRQCFLADIPQNKRLRRFLREEIAPLI